MGQAIVGVAVGGPADVGRALLASTILYVVLLVVLRTSGKRTLAKLNAFDLVVTVAIGSTLASGITSAEVPLLATTGALMGLAALQWVVARLSTISRQWRGVVRADPTLLVRDGHMLHDAMHRSRVTDSEILQVVRQKGMSGLEGVAAVVLETDGSLSVISNADGDAAAMRDVPGWVQTG